EFVQHELAVDGKIPNRIYLEVEAQQYAVAAAVLLFDRPEKNHRVEVAEFEFARADCIIRRKDNRLKQTNVDLAADVHTQVVKRGVLVGVAQEIACAAVLCAGRFGLYLAYGENV